MNKCFFIKEIIPVLLTIIVIYLESILKKIYTINTDIYLFLILIPTIGIYLYMSKIFKQKITHYLKYKNIC